MFFKKMKKKVVSIRGIFRVFKISKNMHFSEILIGKILKKALKIKQKRNYLKFY